MSSSYYNTTEKIQQQQQDKSSELAIQKLASFGSNGVEIIDNDVYHIVDLELKNLFGEVKKTISRTILYPNKTTRGHVHEHHDESYHFLKGNGLLLLQRTDLNKLFYIEPETWIDIPKETYHMVINTSINEDLEFETEFPGPSERPPFNNEKKIQNGKKKK